MFWYFIVCFGAYLLGMVFTKLNMKGMGRCAYNCTGPCTPACDRASKDWVTMLMLRAAIVCGFYGFFVACFADRQQLSVESSVFAAGFCGWLGILERLCRAENPAS